MNTRNSGRNIRSQKSLWNCHEPKVLLIHSPSNMERPQFTPRLPTNLTSLAAYLINNGIGADILDLVTIIEDWNRIRFLLQRALQNNYLLIGLAVSLTDFRYEAQKVAAIIKDICPCNFLVIGGQHATAMPEQMIRNYYADVVIMGEGEQTLLELCRSRLDGTPIENVKGLCLLSDGEVRSTGLRKNAKILSCFPRPVHEILEDFEKYLEHDTRETFSLWKAHKRRSGKGRMIQILGSRGCPNKCSFCSSSSFWGRGVRVRSIDAIIDEMELWHSMYGVNFFRIDDDTLTLTESRIVEFCSRLKDKGLDIEWEAQTRIDMISKKMMAPMAKSGCVAMGFGIESGSEEMRKVLGKELRISQTEMVENLLMAKESGVPIAIYLLVGAPGETDSTIQESIDLVKKVRPHYISPVRIEIRPGTDLYSYACENYGITDDIWLNGPAILYNTFEKSEEELRRYMYEIRKAWIDSLDLPVKMKILPIIKALENYYDVDFEIENGITL